MADTAQLTMMDRLGTVAAAAYAAERDKGGLNIDAREIVRAILTELRTLSADASDAAAMAVCDRFRGDGGWCGLEAGREQAMDSHRAMIDAILNANA